MTVREVWAFLPKKCGGEVSLCYLGIRRSRFPHGNLCVVREVPLFCTTANYFGCSEKRAGPTDPKIGSGKEPARGNSLWQRQNSPLLFFVKKDTSSIPNNRRGTVSRNPEAVPCHANQIGDILFAISFGQKRTFPRRADATRAGSFWYSDSLSSFQYTARICCARSVLLLMSAFRTVLGR